MTHRALTVLAWIAGYITFLGVINAVMAGGVGMFAAGLVVLAVAVIGLDWIEWKGKA